MFIAHVNTKKKSKKRIKKISLSQSSAYRTNRAFPCSRFSKCSSGWTKRSKIVLSVVELTCSFSFEEKILGFTLEAKLVSTTKHLIQVHLKILGRSVGKMASHLLRKYITWSIGCYSSFAVKSFMHITNVIARDKS